MNIMLTKELERRDKMKDEMDNEMMEMQEREEMMENLEMPQLELARAYIPYQQYAKSYSDEEALHKGTMFPELYSPYDKHEEMRGGIHV